MEATRRFYDGLAADYHLVCADWDVAIARQAASLEEVLKGRGIAPPARVWDGTCGIGTQALGLAARGYLVVGSDLSPGAVERARMEAVQRGLRVDFAVHDVRTGPLAPGAFDAVLSGDNSFPHLLGDSDLSAALTAAARALRSGGALAVGMRDYDALLLNRPTGTPPSRRKTPDGHAVVFQLWDWDSDGTTYEMHLFVLRQQDDSWATSEYTATYRALRQQELADLAQDCGFREPQWLVPEETHLHQPLMVAALQ